MVTRSAGAGGDLAAGRDRPRRAADHHHPPLARRTARSASTPACSIQVAAGVSWTSKPGPSGSMPGRPTRPWTAPSRSLPPSWRRGARRSRRVSASSGRCAVRAGSSPLARLVRGCSRTSGGRELDLEPPQRPLRAGAAETGRPTLVGAADRFQPGRDRAGRLVLSQPLKLADGRATGLSLRLTIAAATPAPGGLSLTFETTGQSDYQLERLTALEGALPTTEADDGRAVLPFRLGEPLSAATALPQVRALTTYSPATMQMVALEKAGAALLVTWDHVDVKTITRLAWLDHPLVAGRRALFQSLELTGGARTVRLHPLGRGNYVTAARAYRDVAARAGWRVTRAEQARTRPQVNAMAGAADFKPSSSAAACPVRGTTARGGSRPTSATPSPRPPSWPSTGVTTWTSTRPSWCWPAGSTAATTTSTPTSCPPRPNAAAMPSWPRPASGSGRWGTRSACTTTIRTCTKTRRRSTRSTCARVQTASR